MELPAPVIDTVLPLTGLVQQHGDPAQQVIGLDVAQPVHRAEALAQFFHQAHGEQAQPGGGGQLQRAAPRRIRRAGYGDDDMRAEAMQERVNIVVLGGALEPSQLRSSNGQASLNEAADLLRRHPYLQFVFCGGKGAHSGRKA